MEDFSDDTKTVEWLHELEHKLATLIDKETRAYAKKFKKKIDGELVLVCTGSLFTRFCYGLGIDEEKAHDVIAQLWENFEENGEFEAMDEDLEALEDEEKIDPSKLN